MPSTTHKGSLCQEAETRPRSLGLCRLSWQVNALPLPAGRNSSNAVKEPSLQQQGRQGEQHHPSDNAVWKHAGKVLPRTSLWEPRMQEHSIPEFKKAWLACATVGELNSVNSP